MAGNEQRDTAEQAGFRHYCRDWLRGNLPPPPPVRLPQAAIEIMTSEQMQYLQAWQKAAYDAGLIGCDYPVEYGGGGRTDCQRIANDEMTAVATPFLPNIIGLGMAAPTIFFHAREEKKRQLLPGLLSGEEVWCQGFSEPGAGSDLASVQASAVRQGDKWIINGHKVWTSLAHFADWMIILARTDKSHKYDGLSYFVVPIKSALGKSVTVRPLIKITGETGFNEVLFENLEIEENCLLDEVGRGWQVAMTTLAHERGAGLLVTPRSGGRSQGSEDGGMSLGARRLGELAKTCYRNGRAVVDDAVMRDKIMQQIIREEGFKHNGRRAMVTQLCDHPMRLPLQNKLQISEIMQENAALALEIEGMRSSLYKADLNAPDKGHWPLAYMNSFGFTIAAGTSEVQRNILGERVLDLPKSK